MNDFTTSPPPGCDEARDDAMRQRVIRAVDRLDQGIGIVDAEFRLELFNRAFVTLLGLSDGSVAVGLALDGLTRLGLERGDGAAGEIEILSRRCGERAGARAGCRAEYLRPDGTALELWCHPLDGTGFVVTIRDISKRRRAEGRFEDAVHSLAEGFMLWDADDRLIACNDSIRQAYPGLDDILVPGRRFEDNLRESIRRGVIVAPPDVDLESWIRQRIDQHRNPSEPIERFTSDGRWLRIVEHLTSEGGIVGVVVDVTDLKRAGTALQRSEQRFRDFASASSDWFWEMGPDLRFTWFSEQMERIIGMSADRLTGMTREELGRPDPQDEKWGRHLADLRARRPFRDFRYPASDDHGEKVWLSVSGVPVFDAAGRFQGYRGTGTNVTAEVRAEAKAAEAQERLRDAIESITDGFALYDRDDRLVLYNDNYRRALSGIADQLSPGARFEDLFRVLVERGQIRAPTGGEEEWIRERLAERRQPGATRAYETCDGRWIEVHEYPTRDGGRVIIRTDATAAKQAELDLRRSQASLANAQRIARLGNWDLRVTANEFWWSDEIYRIFGLEPQALPATYDLFLDIVHPDDRHRVRRAIDATLYRGAPFGFEHRIVRPDGGERIVQQEGEVVFDELGTPLRMSGTVQDVTELKKAEEELRKLERAVEQGPAAVIVTDTEGAIEYVNPKFAEMTGYDRDEAIGLTPRLLKSGVMGRSDYATLWSTIKDGREWRGELCNRRKDGSLYWASASISPIKGREGRISHFIGVQEDITERKRAEERLRASEERFRQLVESSVLGIVIDQGGKPLFANRTYANIFGYDSPDDILALATLDRLYADGHLDRIRHYRNARKTGEQAPDEYEFQGVKKDGSLIWIRTQVKLIPWNGETAVQSTVVDISIRKIYEQRLHYQANFDAVTELPNRTLALDRLNTVVAGAKRHARKVGVLFIDIDHFKKINDTLGHALGDRFLRQAGQRIKACVREEDTVARLGGDEFTVILPDIRSSKDTEGVARKILDALARPFSLDGQEAFVSASIGITVCPDDGGDPESLMRNADAAMYQAKESGRNTLRFFTPELNERALDRIQMETALRRGLERQEFALHYQPLVDIRSGGIIGAEALLRWHNPELGTVKPDRFVRLAEDTGLIVPIGEWVLHTACHQAGIWQAATARRFRLSVNVSSRQFRGTALVDAVGRALGHNRFPAECLELEITEGLLMEDLSETMETIRTLEARGVRLAIDDFGTGYSSLSYLNRFPLDTLKIDRSFTHGMLSDRAHATLVEAIIAMGHHLNLRVIAEGVETREQLEFLKGRGCDVAQGYYFSPPLPCEAFTKLLENWRHHRACAS